jgi:hypothetical protein
MSSNLEPLAELSAGGLDKEAEEWFEEVWGSMLDCENKNGAFRSEHRRGNLRPDFKRPVILVRMREKEPGQPEALMRSHWSTVRARTPNIK